MTSQGTIKITKDLEEDIAGKNVVIVEDIIDSGLTLKYVSEALESETPNR